MRRKAYIPFILVLCLLMSGCSGLNRLRNIRVTSAELESASPRGFRSLAGTVLLGIESPEGYTEFFDTEGYISRLGVKIGTFDVEPVILDAGGSQSCRLFVTVSLMPDISVMEVLSLMSDFNLNDYTLDLKTMVRFRPDAKGIKLSFKDKTVSDIINRRI